MRRQHFRLAHEILFSLNVGLVTRWLMANANYFASELSLQLWMSQILHIHPHSTVGSNLAFLILSFEVALGVFVLLVILRKYASARVFAPLTGILSLVALPLAWLYSTHALHSGAGRTFLPFAMLLLELLAATACGFVYSSGRWSLPTGAGAALLLVHFVFWDAVCFGPYFWFEPFKSIFALVGLGSSLTWPSYARITGAVESPLRQNA